MMNNTRPWGAVASVLGMMVALAACSSEAEESGGSRFDTGGAGGSGPPSEPVCPEKNQACTCDSGAPGKLNCLPSGNIRCECPIVCHDVTPQAAGWAACGGEPFGQWRLTGVSFDGASQSMFVSNGYTIVHTGQCEAEVARPATLSSFSLDIRDGGVAVLEAGVLGFSLFIDRSCIRSKTNGGDCKNLLIGKEYSCKDDYGCGGLCRCDTQHLLTSGKGSWSRKGDRLSLYIDGTSYVSDYCVSGDRMVLRDTQGLVISLERVTLSGKPAACADRPTGSCVGAGCWLGVCTGAGKCAEAKSESACGTFQGCSWQADACAGKAAESCALAEHGVVPGCEIAPVGGGSVSQVEEIFRPVCGASMWTTSAACAACLDENCCSEASSCHHSGLCPACLEGDESMPCKTNDMWGWFKGCRQKSCADVCP